MERKGRREREREGEGEEDGEEVSERKGDKRRSKSLQLAALVASHCIMIPHLDLACASAATTHGGVAPRDFFTQAPIPRMPSQDPVSSRA